MVFVQIRKHTKEDLPFIYRSWLMGQYYGLDLFSLSKKDSFMNAYRKIIDHILQRPNTEIQIAALAEDQEIILGYSILEKDALHWVFVKKEFRKMGIAKKLIPEHIRTTTAITELGKILLPKHITFDLFYDPSSNDSKELQLS